MSEAATTPLPLQGKRVLVTRTREQAASLSERLSALGAVPVEFPAIRIAPPQDWTQLDAALARLYRTNQDVIWPASHPTQSSYSWLVFTSANAVRICCERLKALRYDISALRGVRIAAIGPATAAALEQYGLPADLVPGEYVAEGVAAVLIADSRQRGETLAGKHFLLPRAAGARDVLPAALQQAGALVDEIPAYTTLPATNDDEASHVIQAMLRAGQIDVITFTSSSTVRHFMRWLSGHLSAQLPLIACIGPVTAQTAREHGLDVQIEAATFTIGGLVAAIVDYYRTHE